MASSRKQKAIETRERLVKAGEAIFLEQGFQKTTIAQIIKKAETGYGTAYVYFKNKDELLIELMQTMMNFFYQVSELSFEPSTKEEAKELIVYQTKEFLSLAISYKSLMQVIKEAIGYSNAVEDQWTSIRLRFIEGITNDITYAQTQGLVAKDINPHYAAKSWFYTNEMFMWEFVCSKEKDDLDVVINTITDMYINGLYE
ncbi:TetR/AcrR family transcriptional regulator [Alkalicoccobacillus plakortidis]|uniref:TetR/AcrR family transcriptional regulator n=1 Tax=Alkalicoccobacillus plakortidis TaxID=444060 RepID=A0ABT0XIR3_9BACI|nr:TetR/AcrR family transcriptional regulator [Alkalicoccobacillus plakortidis]MCM2675797.1 TetR/AcrR family transcriptional regulator [Alkalicoccobacillus plakortidis]